MLKLQYFGHLMQRTDSLEKTLMLGKAGGEGDARGWDGWMASLTQWTWVWASSGRWWRTGKPSVLHAVHGVTKSRIQLSDWTTNDHSPHWSKKPPLWSAHSRWLFSCSLYIPCWTSTCFIFILHTWLTFLCTCLRPQLVIVLIKGVVRGHAPLLVSLVTNEPSWNQFPQTRSSPFYPGVKTAAIFCPQTALHLGVHSRTLLHVSKLLYPLNHQCLCCWPWALS